MFNRASFCIAFVAFSVWVLRQYISPVLPELHENWSDYNVVITGGCHGIGYEISKALHKHNATVILGCRNISNVYNSFATNLKSFDTNRLFLYELDLSEFSIVRKFAHNILTNHKSVNILINNAGIRQNHFEITQDDIELHYQVNHLSHFLLTKLLLPLLIRSSSISHRSRIIHVSSSAHSFGYIDKSAYDINNRNTNASKFQSIQNSRIEGVYGDTKLMQILFSDFLQYKINNNYELLQIFNYTNSDYSYLEEMKDMKSKLLSISVHPGFVNSNMGYADNRWMQTAIVLLRPILSRSVQQGALAVICALTSNELKGSEYLDNCKITTSKSKLDISKNTSTNNNDKFEIASWLWNTSESIIES